MKELDATKMKRLAFIKGLYRLAVTQSRTTDFLSASSILIFHDAAELLLQLCAEHVQAKTAKNTDFLQYWEFLSESLGKILPHKEAMHRLNRARVSLKHGGILPDPLEIEGFRAAVTNFMIDTTRLVFEVDFENVSLIMLVQPEQSRNDLLEARRFVQAEEYSEAIGCVALAFQRMLDESEERARKFRRPSPFKFVKLPRRMGLGGPDLGGIDDEKTRRVLQDFIRYVTEDLETIQDGMRTIALGLNSSGYTRFRDLMPVVHQFMNGRYTVSRTIAHPRVEADHDDVMFCIDFVVETSIALQESDRILGPERGAED